MNEQIPPPPPSSCSDGAILLLGRRCVEGVWGEMVWIMSEEFEGGGLRVAGTCAKAEAIRTARELKWTAEELVKVLKTLG